jgi:hypothetical protein
MRGCAEDSPPAYAMSRIEEALKRLERAVARLEAACRVGAGGADPAAAPGGAEGEAENRRLRETADEIAARVDQALAKVGRVLKGEA